MRHKLITVVEIDEWENFFYELKTSDCIVEEYEYTLAKDKRENMTSVGAFHKVTDNGSTFFAIATNTGQKWGSYKNGKRSYTHNRIMYKLNDKGVQFIQDYIFMKNLGGDV